MRPSRQQPVQPPSPASLRARTRLLAALGFGLLVVAAAAAGFGLWRRMTPPHFAPLSAADAGPSADMDVRLSGVAQTELVAQVRTLRNGGMAVSTYLPVTAPGWTKDRPVAFFLLAPAPAYAGPDGRHAYAAGTPPFPIAQTGVLRPDGLPPAVRTAYRQQGLSLAPLVYVLDTDAAVDASAQWLQAAVALGCGVLLLLAAGLMRSFARRAERSG